MWRDLVERVFDSGRSHDGGRERLGAPELGKREGEERRGGEY